MKYKLTIIVLCMFLCAMITGSIFIKNFVVAVDQIQEQKRAIIGKFVTIPRLDISGTINGATIPDGPYEVIFKGTNGSIQTVSVAKALVKFKDQ